jgi:Fic family protein
MSSQEATNQEDITEVVNYIKAMDVGLSAIETGNVTLSLIKEMHQVLLQEGRGSEKHPGQFRTVQNWVGSRSGGIRNATYVPPPPDELDALLHDFETYLQATVANNVLIATGLAHAHFESIHPFLDGNGRIGRLLLTLLLVHHKVLSKPLLYLSYYFKHRRIEYYDRLQAVRDHGDWEGWIAFYLRGLKAVAEEAAETAKAIVQLRQRDLDKISTELGSKSGKAIQLLEHLYHHPIVNVQAVQQALGEGYQTSNRLISSLEQIGILKELTGQQRNRKFGYVEYIAFFDDDSF